MYGEGLKEIWQGKAHVERWLRVLETFSSTANDSKGDDFQRGRELLQPRLAALEPVLEALEYMEQQALDTE